MSRIEELRKEQKAYRAEVAAYIQEHPEVKRSDIATKFGVSLQTLTNIAHEFGAFRSRKQVSHG